MKATQEMQAMTREEISSQPEFDPEKVIGLVLDETKLAISELVNSGESNGRSKLAATVIARLLRDNCGFTQKAIADRLGYKCHTSVGDLFKAMRSHKLDEAAGDLGFTSPRKFEAYIFGMLTMTNDFTKAA